MSELINARERRIAFRLQLLATVSAMALLNVACASAHASDSDHPIVWLELDGQFAQQETGAVPFVPPFLANSPFSATSHLSDQRASPTSWESGASISFQPTDSDWVIQASLRYGKSGRHLNLDHLTSHKTPYFSKYHAYQNFKFSGSESHAIADFKAGRDVGLGAFGSNGSSIFSLGVRYAQFSSRSTAHIQSQPVNLPLFYNYTRTFYIQRFYADFSAQRKFTGVGPSLSWDASARLIGNPQAGSSISLDWGANGAVLFGRQRTKIDHQTTDNGHVRQTRPTYSRYQQTHATILHYRHSGSPDRNRQVMVPNIGGFAGVSWRYSTAKVTLGYRADLFFGAIDGGIDTAHRENRGFYGPFASVSVGLGG